MLKLCRKQNDLLFIGTHAVASVGGTRGRTALGDTLMGVTPEGKKLVGKFTKNSGKTRSDRQKGSG